MTPKEVVRAFHAAFVARDVEGLCALYADDAVNHQVAEEPLRGKEAIRKSFEEFFRAFPDETTEVLNVFQDGEWGMWEWRGGNPNISPGAPTVFGCGFFHVRDGLIVLQRGYWDKLTFLRAHGLPVPGGAP
jgi:steroid delta-isomerase-like uncharacterized protein